MCRVIGLLLCTFALSGCAYWEAIKESNRDPLAYWIKMRGSEMMDTPGSNLNLIRGLVNRFPTYYRAPVCNDHGCWVAP